MSARYLPAAAFRIQDVEVRPGHVVRSRLPIARMPTGGDLALPLIVAHGVEAGPVLAVTAAIHGDELNGTLVISELVANLDARQLRGTLLALPILNPLGLLNRSRYLPDRRDLNRCFPGSKRGSLGSRIAHAFTTGVVERADVLVDLHTGSAGRKNLPQVRCDLNDPKNREFARAFGAPAVVHSELRDGSLRAISVAHGKPVLVYEAGEALRADNEAVQIGHYGILNVMRHMRMLDAEQLAAAQERLEMKDGARQTKPRLYSETTWLRAARSGFCALRVALGERVKEGQDLGWIDDPVGGKRVRIRSNCAGLVIGALAVTLVNRGDAILHVATTRYAATSQ